jgi:uncharacterized membrane protein
MTGLLIGTFIIAGLHTLLWIPRSIQWRRKLKNKHDLAKKENSNEPGENNG